MSKERSTKTVNIALTLARHSQTLSTERKEHDRSNNVFSDECALLTLALLLKILAAFVLVAECLYVCVFVGVGVSVSWFNQ